MESGTRSIYTKRQDYSAFWVKSITRNIVLAEKPLAAQPVSDSDGFHKGRTIPVEADNMTRQEVEVLVL